MSAKYRLFSRVGNTRIIPMGLKILGIFISLILLSNFATNVISVQFSQNEILKLNNTIMVEQLKELYNNASNQYQIYTYSKNQEESMNSICASVATGFSNKGSVAVGISKTGDVLFFASRKDIDPDFVYPAWLSFDDQTALFTMDNNLLEKVTEGSIKFVQNNYEYIGVYKYQPDWDCYLIRAERKIDLSERSQKIYIYITIIILSLTICFIILGSIIIKREFKTVTLITKELYEMQKRKQLDLIDLSEAPNDDITYMAASFNSLSSSVNNLLGTFQKFVPTDVVHKAYTDQKIALEGSQRELTMLFSDIKSFTYRTETLGNDIIDVLNVHYDKVIHNVHENNGVVGSIIGDAILAIYGTLDSPMSKSYSAICAAWDITHVTANLRQTMILRREEVEKRRKLTESEKYMKAAIREARKAHTLGEVPIGCVIVYEGKIIGRGYNRRKTDKNTLSHAELTAICLRSR